MNWASAQVAFQNKNKWKWSGGDGRVFEIFLHFTNNDKIWMMKERVAVNFATKWKLFWNYQIVSSMI